MSWSLALLAAMATQTTETIADIVRTFNALTEQDMAYKPFHRKLAKPQFPEFMRLVVGHLLDTLVADALVLSTADTCPATVADACKTS